MHINKLKKSFDIIIAGYITDDITINILIII